jgi:hypothetical protein
MSPLQPINTDGFALCRYNLAWHTNIVRVKGAPSFNAHDYYVYVPLGRYVVDKAGEDQQTAGVSYAPFVPTSLNRTLVPKC